MKQKNQASLNPFLLLTILLVAATISACAPAFDKTDSASVSNSASATVGCTSFEDSFYDSLYNITLQNHQLPSEEEMARAFADTLQNDQSGRLAQLSQAEQTLLQTHLTQLYHLLAVEAPQKTKISTTNAGATLKLLSAIKMGDRTSPEKNSLQDKVRAEFGAVQTLAAQLTRSSCGNSTTGSPSNTQTATTPPNSSGTDDLLSEWKQTRKPAAYGALKAFSTAYQSCDAALIRTLDDTTPSVQGISVIGTHPDGVGLVRTISNLKELIATNPFLSSYHQPNNSCFSVTQKPMIYNYGGKPAVASSQTPRLDFFTPAGTGNSQVLGIDCSAFVYSSLATAGLKLKKTGKLTAVDVNGVSSSMFNHPQANGLTCLDNAVFDSASTLEEGDILAMNGHVLLIDSVGQDPFGIAGLTTESQCKAANISSSRFNFTILQSSNSLGGIGINHMQAAAFLKTDPTMELGMIDHAVTACLAGARKSSIKTNSAHANLVRHSDTTDCRDTAISLAHEECVSECPTSNLAGLP